MSPSFAFRFTLSKNSSSPLTLMIFTKSPSYFMSKNLFRPGTYFLGMWNLHLASSLPSLDLNSPVCITSISISYSLQATPMKPSETHTIFSTCLDLNVFRTVYFLSVSKILSFPVFRNMLFWSFEIFTFNAAPFLNLSYLIDL